MPPTDSINRLSFPTIADALVKPKRERFYGAVVKQWRVVRSALVPFFLAACGARAPRFHGGEGIAETPPAPLGAWAKLREASDCAADSFEYQPLSSG
jgi:hypothetical protein